MLWPVFHPVTASLVHICSLRTGCTNADCINHRPHHTGVKGKKKGSKDCDFFFFCALTLPTIQRNMTSAFSKNSGFPWHRAWAKAQWYTLHPLWGGSPLAQFNGQLGHYSQLAVSTDVPMAWHMGIHAHAHTHSPGTIYFLRKHHLYKPKNGLMPNFGEFACVCRHGNVYVLHTIHGTTVASGQNFWLMFITHQHSLGESLR